MSSLTFISSESPDFDRLRAYYLNGIYFDGKTEDYFKYDCCGLLSGMLTYGIHNCTIHGYPNPCRAYIWEYKHGHFFLARADSRCLGRTCHRKSRIRIQRTTADPVKL